MDTRERLEVRHWVQRAIALYESAGKEDTLARVADPEGPFIRGSRYIFALGLDGNLLAHPFSKQLVGQNLTGLRDSEGRSFIRKLIATAKTRGYGFAEYKWPVPDSKEELHKTVFFEQVDEMVLCSGFYSVKESPFETICRCLRSYGLCW
jgi:cytochrome c